MNMEGSKAPIIYLLSLVLFFSVVPSILAQEVEDEREFNYMKGSERGPEHWGELRPEWGNCSTGEMQSPIDLWHSRVKVVPKFEEITRFYRPSNALLRNRGHDIELEWEGERSTIEINGTRYILRQTHWHSPSEHTINGKRYDGELHMVHQSRDEKIAVIGLLYKIGKPNHFLSKLENQVRLISETTLEINVGVVNPAKIKMGGRNFYRYIGSLTTPPCTEGVLWTVNTRIGTISQEQLDLLREAVHDDAERNARPLQPSNGRKMNLYTHMIKNRQQ
ncbi:hypothetical protein SOVF_142640 [Spinacia oleracea]|uniref:Carbonic anhydrase n=1 Tax=Spinacia oleracea TaxID=3562 RepID=A0A9R0K7A4_SPIOL|nr:alpha carbonic anhydrase 7-like [Spinacia oleracea]KNA10625.1 hypothetical protein SOVF_142640 [Spinacia oleracea]